MTLYGEGSNASSTNKESNLQEGIERPNNLRLLNDRALGSGELNSQNERELRCSEGSGMLIGDPLW